MKSEVFPKRDNFHLPLKHRKLHQQPSTNEEPLVIYKSSHTSKPSHLKKYQTTTQLIPPKEPKIDEISDCKPFQSIAETDMLTDRKTRAQSITEYLKSIDPPKKESQKVPKNDGEIE